LSQTILDAYEPALGAATGASASEARDIGVVDDDDDEVGTD
jgi:hypothetical protein